MLMRLATGVNFINFLWTASVLVDYTHLTVAQGRASIQSKSWA
jgi:hypothetical protein